MRATRNKAVAIAAAVVVLVAALMTTVARAAIPHGGNSLTIGFCETPDWKADFSTSSPVADVVCIATAIPHEGDDGYDYDFAAAGFSGLEMPVDQDGWATLAEQAARRITPSTETIKIRDGETARDLGAGIYLALVHDADRELAYGDGIASSLTVETKEWTYSFAPTAIALPSRADGNSGAWQKDVTVTMKQTRAPGSGSIRIDKAVRGYDGKPAVFVYDIRGYDDRGNLAYHESRSIRVASSQEGDVTESLVVSPVPTGLKIQVDEEYSGAGYSLVDRAGPDDAVTSREGQPRFSFVNERNGDGVSGDGIRNEFVYDEDGNGDWTWHAAPAEKAGER